MLVGLNEILAEGKRRGIAVGSFNTPNLECLLAVLDAAEELELPVIVAHAQIHESVAPLDKIGRVMVALASAAKVPVCVHLDHGEDLKTCQKAISLGFTSVMIDYSTLPYEENVTKTRQVVEYAHAHGVDVEAELGALPQREGGSGPVALKKEDLYTVPELVPDYIARTGIDALAIAFGTAHGIYKEKPILNMDIIAQVRALTDRPLVMHGGSGISHEEYRQVIALGIGKINYFSYMSYDGYEAAAKTVAKVPSDFFHNLARNAQDAMYENAKETLRVFAGM